VFCVHCFCEFKHNLRHLYSSSTSSGLCARGEQANVLDTNSFAWRCTSCYCGTGSRDHPPSTGRRQQVWIMFGVTFLLHFCCYQTSTNQANMERSTLAKFF